MKKIVSVMLCLVMVFAFFVPINAANDFKDAKNYTLGTFESARIINGMGNNVYKFNLAHPAKISIDISSEAYKFGVKVLDKAGKELLSDKPAQKASDGMLNYKSDLYINPGDYYLSIINSGQEGRFNLAIYPDYTYESFTEAQNGSNNTMKEASGVYLGSSYAGFIATNDDTDFYKFTMNSEGKVVLNVTSETERLHTKIYDETGKELWSDSPVGVTSVGFSVSNNLYLNKGNYYFSVTKAVGEGRYSFGIAYESVSESFTEAQCGNNNKTEAACPIVKNQKYIGFFSLNDDTDTYRIAINEPSLSFTVVSSDVHQMQVTIHNINGKQLVNHNIVADKYSAKINTTKEIVVPEGACFLAIKRMSGYGAFTFSLTDSGYAAEPPVPQPVICVSIKDKLVSFDQSPVLEDGRTLVPLRAIFEALGASVEWDAMTQTVKSIKGNTQISMQIGSATMYVNGSPKTLDVAAKIINGRTLVPVRAISEAFGCKVEWDQYSQTVVIKQ